MRRKKIIHLYRRAYDAYFPAKNSEYYFLAGWSGMIARRTAEYTSKYRIENWRPEREAKFIESREVQDVMCRIFPARHAKYLGDYSPSMLRMLRSESKNSDILIHHNGIHSNALYCMAYLLPDIPIVAQQHGDAPALYRFNLNRRFVNYSSSLIEKNALKHIDHFFILREGERQFLSRFTPASRMSKLTVGVDYNNFRPMGKIAARRRLGIPRHAPVVLYVGRFYRLKGVDLLLETYRELKASMDVNFVLIGGSPRDELYADVRGSGVIHRGYLPHALLPLYMSAADVYLHPAFDPNYWGIDVSVIEALACGVPVVSPVLSEFPADIRCGLGETPTGREDVMRCLVQVLREPARYANCRNLSRPYFDWPAIIARMERVYDTLFETYYRGKS